MLLLKTSNLGPKRTKGDENAKLSHLDLVAESQREARSSPCSINGGRVHSVLP